MKVLILLTTVFSFLFSMEYYSKIEPINTYVNKASVSGKIVFSNERLEGKSANNSLIIEIDNNIDKVDLKQSNIKLGLLEELIKIETSNLNKINSISSKSQYEKNTQKSKLINLKSQKADMLIKIATLKDKIKNKKIYVKNNYIYKIYVKKGDYVNAGTTLYESKDLSKAKLEIFVSITDISEIKNKSIFINDKLTNYKISKIFKVADSKHISSYKCEIIIDSVKEFSKLVKIEFK